MKLKNIAKASLALGILTTGMITTTAQPVKASEQSRLSVISNDTQELKSYYSGTGFNFQNVSGYREKDKMNIINGPQLNVVTLLGTDKDRFRDGDYYNNLDVFVVREGTGRQADNNSIGGITKTNKNQYKDPAQNVNLLTYKSTGQNTTSVTSEYYSIDKEEISLKELDFKLRKHLMDKHDLYKTEPKDSKIKVTMKNGGFYTFELNKKLQEHRMGDVIDGTKIKEINVELN
ncbi:superantigen-like protein SSL11 [Staphylococcus argenteus]|uniref:superantigen-like protein SSL11 n=1 Tax=Staphylococcus argenteus TaxID=985002 RepID=UPI001FB95A4D|nr:superantigen-like protein SSL11 [Staphylococcus argenteus]MCG9795721.1 superantigen-like protein SSL11 [Staphylococcus argenteus]GJF44946.1 superantigen-like protein SSL11 [Staphylococcus argenteus]GJF53658.1 superantigen-like protein SSL11 [Staphylococcus argenteus]GJF60142.1 superantigen-like protein SSL11 [Staphylococcus argenteus]GJF73298.1 superantigen-like protein SSL11 [Staphylococcus argenteus]